MQRFRLLAALSAVALTASSAALANDELLKGNYAKARAAYLEKRSPEWHLR